jgi:hypothetical protein
MRILKNIRAVIFLIYISLSMGEVWCIHDHEILPIGNYALRTALEPGPLFGFGQTVVDKNDLLLIEEYIYYYLSSLTLKSHVLHTALLYGITDRFSVLFSVPAIAKSQQNCQKFGGLADILIQGEYAFLSYSPDNRSNIQSTIVAYMTLPTGPSDAQNAILGLGSPSFFIGSTASYTTTKLYAFGALGALLTTYNNGVKPGNLILYETGLGYNLGYKTNSWILTGILEFNGIYYQPNKIEGFDQPKTQGNIIFFGPILFFSYKCVSTQAGIQGGIIQSGYKNYSNLRAAMEIAFVF